MPRLSVEPTPQHARPLFARRHERRRAASLAVVKES